MIETIIDTPVRVTPHLDRLREQGIRTVIRYYNHRNSRTLPEKRLTREEAVAVSDHGLTLGVVFQQRGRLLRDFSSERGRGDAQRALECAANIGQPEGSTIYFGVDHDFFRSHEVAAVMDHFRAVLAEVNGRYEVGAYASGGLCRRLREAGLIRHVWLPRALGWSGSRELHESGRWDLFQNQVDTRLGPIPVDTNVANPAREGFGAFSVTEDSLPPQAPRTLELHEVIARSGLNLRAGPDTSFRVLATLPRGALVEVLEVTETNWALVSREGDDSADGYMHRGFLRPLTGSA